MAATSSSLMRTARLVGRMTGISRRQIIFRTVAGFSPKRSATSSTLSSRNSSTSLV